MNINNIQYKIELSKTGLPTLYVLNDSGEKIYIHSKYDPLKEADSFKSRFNPEKYNAITILGAGLGYHLLPLKNLLNEYRKIIIIDPIKNIKAEIEKNHKTGFLALSDKITFLAGLNTQEIEKKLADEIDFTEINGLDVISLSSSVRLFDGYYTEIERIIRRIIDKKAGNIVTKKTFGSLYLKNIFKNFNSFPLLYPVSSFFYKMNNYPVLIIASGPSIENYIDKIKNNQDNFFIIAVDSAMGPLIRNDIIPDFFVSIDPQPFTYEHIFDLTTAGTIPVFTLSTHPLMLNKFKSTRALLSLNTHPVAQLIDEIFPDYIGHIDSKTGTVAGDAIRMAEKFSFKIKGLLGFDFSFLDYKIYPRGSAYQKRFLCNSGRFNSIETINLNYIMKSSKGLKHNNKFTRRSFMQYKESIEGFLSRLKDTAIFNINKTGIPLEHLQQTGLKDFLKVHCSSSIPKPEIINKIFISTEPTEKYINYSKIYKIFQDKDLFNKIISSSIQISETGSNGKVRRFKSLLSILSGNQVM